MSIAEYRTVQTAVEQALDSAADILTFVPCTPIDVVEFGFIADVLTATAGTVHLDKRVLPNDDTGRVNGTAALGRILTVPDATADGKHVYKIVGTGSAVTGNPGSLEVNPGEEVVVQVIGEPSDGDGTFYIRYRERAQTGSRIATDSTESV